MPRTTIIIPTYNCAPWLARSIESALAQDYSDYEVIIVDDGSSDQTPEVLDRFSNQRRVRVHHQTNMGLPGARNVGAALSDSEFLHFLDADDEYMPNTVSETVEAMRRGQAGYCFTGSVRVRNGQRWEHAAVIAEARRLQAVLRGDMALAGSIGLYFRREDWEAAGRYNPIVKNLEDWELSIRMVERDTRVVCVPKPLYVYYVRDGSITKGGGPEIMRCRALILQLHHRRLADQGVDGVRAIYADKMWHLGQLRWSRERDWRAALACARESLAYDFRWSRLTDPVLRRIGLRPTDKTR